MKEMITKIKELFSNGEIDALLAWHDDEKSGNIVPRLFKKDDDLSGFIFNEKCVHNLTNFLPKLTDRYKKIAIVLKGCDGRALANLTTEHRIRKNQIVALAPACPGVKIHGQNAPKCADCAVRVSPIADFIFGTSEPTKDPVFIELQKIEKMNPEERWQFFSEQFAKCERCYACRQVCPLCYCEVCVIDKQEPKWIEPSAKLSANTMWQLVRAYHLTGRCADCGECERVCPQDIQLRLLNLAMEKSVLELFNIRPGTKPDQIPPLVTLEENDSNAIMEAKHEE